MVSCSGASAQTNPSSQSIASDSPLSLSAQSLNFGNVNLGLTNSLQVNIANTASQNITLSQQSVSGEGFSTEGIGSGVTLNPTQSATLKINFRPDITGNMTGSVVLSSDGTSAPMVITLTGNGTPNEHSVTLNWTSSMSAAVGYNIYRESSSDGPWVRLNVSIDAGLSYTDPTVQNGQSYLYAVSTVSPDDFESALSDPIPVLIPAT
ncbi:MAG TPA: choice-of-anchor D domain-containing protein [Candidatus Acidoferrales bacterium]|nr:choice-of-anchor D domain-containing protein [Candidatus Acidoferrales bacterium]